MNATIHASQPGANTLLPLAEPPFATQGGGCQRRARLPFLAALIALFLLFTPSWLHAQTDDLAPLSDEFTNSVTLANFQRVFQVEGWGAGANKLQTLDINTSTSGRLVMIPYTSSWYNNYVGELTFKAITGDFVITTETIPRNRARTGAPGGLYSLSGIMVRAPSGLTNGAAGWQSGRQNYVFLSHGAANAPGTYQHEVKTTTNSQSTLYISNGVAQAEIQVARLGGSLIMLRRDNGGQWLVHQRYARPDFPATLQAGLTVYTDWNGVQAVYPFGQELQHNSTVITGQNPDLRAEFEYLRYHRPQIPANLAGRNFASPAQVSDAELLAFLGGNANAPYNPVAGAPVITTSPQSQTVNVGANVTFSVVASGNPTLTYQWRRNGTNLAGAIGVSLSLNNVQAGDTGSYTVVVSNGAGNATSAPATLTVNTPGTPPSISAQPQSVTVTAGASATFSVTAAGTAPLAYQWRRNGGGISGANAASYTLANTTTGDSGAQFSVVVSNGSGSVTSSIVTLTVNAAPTGGGGGWNVTNRPADITITTNILAAQPERFGLNLREPSQQNNYTGDPGFEPISIRRQQVATGGGANYIENRSGPRAAQYYTLADGFFDGATVRVYRPSTNGGPLQLVRVATVTNFVGDGWRRLGVLPVTNNVFTDTNAVPGRNYDYQVRAVDRSGSVSTNYEGGTYVTAAALAGTPAVTTNPTWPGSFFRVDTTPPAIPIGLAATPLTGAVRLNWNANTESDLAGYYVYRRFVSLSETNRLYLDSNGPVVQTNDIYFVEMNPDNGPIHLTHDRLHQLMNGSDTWRAQGGATWPYGMNVTAMRDGSTVPPENGGRSSMRLSTTGSHEVSIRQARFSAPQFYSGFYPNLEPGRTYRFDVWLKQTGVPGGTVRVGLSQHYSAVQTSFTVGANWQKFTYLFTAPALPTTASIAEIYVAFTGPGTVWMDNLLLYEDADGNPATYPAFALTPKATAELAAFRPSVMRVWTGVNTDRWGSTLDDWTRAEPEIALHWMSDYGRSAPDDPYKLPTALRMCRDAGADPWLIVGSYFDESEWLGLMEYLAAPYNPATDTPQGKPWAYRRYSQGQQAPWTDVFPRLFLEYGNELWNGSFQYVYANGTIAGQFSEHFFNVAKSSPWYAAVSNQFPFIVNGWIIGTSPAFGFGPSASAASPSSHYNDVATYIGGWESGISVGGSAVSDPGFQDYLLFPPSFLRYYLDRHAATRDGNATSGLRYRVAVYEGGPGYAVPSPGSPFEPVSEAYGKSLAGAVATLDTFLYCTQLGIDPQCYFSYGPGYNWSSHARLADGGQPHVNWLALQMRNQLVTGPMVTATINSGPTVDIPLRTNNLGQFQASAYPATPLVQPYVFRDGGKWSVFLLNRSLSNATSITLRLPFTNITSATLHSLTGDPRANNALASNVTTNSQPVANFSPNFALTLPPGSIYLYVFEETTVAPPPPPPPPAPTAPSVTQHPVGAVVVAGTNYTFTVSATGTAPLLYQWVRNNAAIPGANGPSLTLSNVTRTNTGTYSVQVGNAGGATASQPATLRVLNAPRLRPGQRLGDGAYRLFFDDHDGGALGLADSTNFEVWVSTNLVAPNWIRLNLPLTVTNGMLSLDDVEAPNHPRRFYRVIER